MFIKNILFLGGFLFCSINFSFSQTVDLIIQSQSASPSTVAAGNSIPTTCYIYNQGNSSAASSNVGYYLSTDAVWDAGDTYLNYYSGSTLAASSSAYKSISLTIPNGTAPGSYYILFYADYSNVVSESIESNNVSSVPITVVAPTIDLIIQSQTASPSSVAAGNTISASCYLYNQGTSTASTSNVGYYLSTDAVWDAGDTYLNYSTGSSLAASGSYYCSSTLTIPAATAAGSYYILYFADYSNTVSESVETNNVASVAINVIAPVVDLVVQSQSASPTTVPSGGTVSASCYIYNQGNSTAASSNVGFYLSTDAIWDAGDTYLTYASGAALAASTSSYRSATLTIPGGTTPGSYYILYYADYSNVVVESIETNNVIVSAINVVAPNTDLIIQSQSTNPIVVPAGGTTTSSCNIYNQGNTTVTSSNVGYYLSTDATWDAGDVFLNYSSGGTLSPNTSSARSLSLTIPGGTTPGSYYLLFYADYSNVVAENVETNNVNYTSITVVAPTVDLIIQSQTTSPLTVASGTSTSASCYIYNQGNSTAASSNVGFYLSTDAVWDASDVFLSSSTGTSLMASTSSYRSATLTIPGGTTPGSYYILYYADYSGAVSESSETNNVNYTSITVAAPTIDLVIQSQTSSPLSIAAGATTNASCNIFNQGNSAASSSSVGFYLSTDAVWDASDVFLVSSPGGALNASTSASRSATLTIPGGTAIGSYYILYYADESHSVTESSETNNVASVPISIVAPTVDLIIQNQSASPTTVFAGNSVSASCYIYNQGNSSASSSNVGFYLSTDAVWDASDVYLNNSTGFTLAAATSVYRSASLIIPAATAAGSYYLLYFADYSGAVSESSETNNVASVMITVSTPSIDLIIQSQSASPTTIIAGNTSSLSCYIYNQGNSSAASSNIGFYLSTNATWDASDVYLNSSAGSALAAATSSYRTATVTIPSATTPGSYYLLYFADYSGAVSETVETNNVATVPITVATPAIDLVIQNPAVATTTVFAGNSVSASCTIYNQGNTSASSSNVGYYLSTDAIWDAADVYLTNSPGSTLAALSSANQNVSLTIPGATTPGSYYILYFADYTNLVTEALETNNVSSLAITVITPSIDLIIQTPAIASATVSAGGNVTATCNIRNQGNSTASSSNVGYYLSTDSIWDAADVYLTNSTGGSLNASAISNKAATLNIPASTAPGPYYILYYADYSALVGETVETNNVVSRPITITPFTNIILVPHTGNTQYSVCSGTIYDDGGTSNYSGADNGTTTLFPSTAGNKIRVVFNSFSVETCCDNLKIYDGPNTSSTLLGTFTSSPGTITSTHASGALTFLFSSDGSVSSSGFEAVISCISSGVLPDLSSINPTSTPMNIPQGSSSTLTCQVLNSGNDTAAASVIGYYLSSDSLWDASDLLLRSDTVSKIKPSGTINKTASITIPVATPVGAYYMLFVSDTANSVSENIETNNVTYLKFNVVLLISVNSVNVDNIISVFPNPSQGEFNFVFDSPAGGLAVIKIYDYVGKVIDEFSSELLPGSTKIVSHSLLVKGIYLTEINLGDRKVFRKIIVQ